MFSPVIIKSLVYAGLSSHVLSISVCLIFGASDYIIGEVFGAFIWIAVYLFHKKNGTW